MKNLKHTPGTWSLQKSYYHDYVNIITPEREYYIGSINGPTYDKAGIDKAEAEANANLIAAAPELLEALRFASTLLHEAEQLYGFRNAVQTREIEKLLERVDGTKATGGAEYFLKETK